MRGRLHLLPEYGRARVDFVRAVLVTQNLSASSTLADDLLELGWLRRGKEYEATLGAYELALRASPDRRLAHRLMAEPLLALGRHEEARKALQRYLESAARCMMGEKSGRSNPGVSLASRFSTRKIRPLSGMTVPLRECRCFPRVHTALGAET